MRSEPITSAAGGGSLIWLLLRKRLNKSVWSCQPACGGETGLFLCGVEECEGVSAAFGGGQNGLSVLAVCCGNTAADSCGRQPV